METPKLKKFTIATTWRENLYTDIICPKKRAVSFEEQIMSNGQIADDIFKVKWELLCLLSFDIRKF